MKPVLDKITGFVCGRSGSLFNRVYACLWFLALLDGGLYAITSILSTETNVSLLGNIGLILLLVTIVAQSWTIYLDLHKMEHDSQSAKELYGPWLNNEWERVLRFAIVVCLLGFVGKVASVLASAALGGVGVFLYAFDLPYHAISLERIDIDLKRNAFSVGGAISYGLLCLWNILAFVHVLLDKKGEAGEPRQRRDTRELLVLARLGGFSLLMGFCCIYWVSYSTGWLNLAGEIPWMLIGIFVTLWIAVLICRVVDRSLKRDAAAAAALAQ